MRGISITISKLEGRCKYNHLKIGGEFRCISILIKRDYQNFQRKIHKYKKLNINTKLKANIKLGVT